MASQLKKNSKNYYKYYKNRQKLTELKILAKTNIYTQCAFRKLNMHNHWFHE